VAGSAGKLSRAKAAPPVTQKHYARRGQVSPEMEFVAIRQGCHIELFLVWLADPAGVFARSCQGRAVGRGYTRAVRSYRDGDVFCWMNLGASAEFLGSTVAVRVTGG
jgi:phosphomethylpyrimidine synthase